ncbi:MAG: hypothetical protein ABUS79_30545, partial [Pseudomonadota bacterium]
MTIGSKSMPRLPVLIVVTRLAAMALLASLPAARARAAAPNPGWEHRQAERDAAEGQRLLKEGLYDDALFKLRAAYSVEPTAETAFGIAGAQRGGGRTLDAYASYETLLRDHGSELTAAERQSAETALAELGLKTGTLKLAIADPEASCTVDGEPVAGDAAGKPIRLLIGAHKVVLTKPTGTATSYDVIIRRGKETELAVPPRRQPAGAPVTLVPAAVAPVAAAPTPLVPAPVVAPAPRPAPAAVVAPPAAVPPPVVQPVVVAPPPTPSPPDPPPAEPPPSVPAAAVEPVAPAPVAEALPPTFEPAPDHRLAAAQPAASSSDDALRVGVILGIVSFPRPIEAELAFKVGRWFGLG